jgi:hypothetical protein
MCRCGSAQVPYGLCALHLSDCGLLGCDTVRSCRWIPTSQMNMLPPSSASCSSEMLVFTYKTARCHNPQDHNLRNHCRENLKTFTLYLFGNISLGSYLSNIRLPESEKISLYVYLFVYEFCKRDLSLSLRNIGSPYQRIMDH